MFLCKERAGSDGLRAGMFRCYDGAESRAIATFMGVGAMKLVIEIVAAVLLIICVSVSSAAFAAGNRPHR